MMNDAGERFTHPSQSMTTLAKHDNHFQKALERKVSHQVSRDFKIYIEAADYWKRFTTHTNRIGLGKVT